MLKSLIASLTPPPPPVEPVPAVTAAATRILRVPQRITAPATQLTGQKRVMALSRKVAAVNRSEINFGNAFRSIQWVPMMLGASGQPVPTDDRLVGAYCAALNRNKDWAAHLGRQLHTPGEGYLSVARRQGSFDWAAWSISEVDTSNAARGVYGLRRSRADQYRPLEPGVDMFRVWTEDGEFARDAWSPLMTQQAIDAMETIVTLDALIKASDQSQLGAGVWKIPAEMFASMRPLLETRDTNGNLIPVDDNALLQRFMSYWSDAAADHTLTPMEQLVPLLAVAPGETLAGMEHVAVKPRYTADELNKRHDAAVKLLAMVMPTPEITLLGLSDTNHWNGKLEKDAAEQLYWGPLGWLVANAITTTHMHQYFTQLKQLRHWDGDPNRVLVGPDTSALTQPPADWQRDLQFFDKGLIGEQAALTRNGYSTEDTPSRSERDRRALERWGDNMLSGGLTTDEKTKLKQSGLLPDDPAAPTPPTDTGAPVTFPTGPLLAAARPRSDIAKYEQMVRRLAAIDARTAGAIAMLAEQAMVTVLREVGFTVRKKATGNPWRSRVANTCPVGTDPIPVFTIAGITAAVASPAEVDEILRAGFVATQRDAEQLLADARNEAWDVVESTVGPVTRPADDSVIKEAAALLVALLLIRVRTWTTGRIDGPADSGSVAAQAAPRIMTGEVASILATAGGSTTTVTAAGTIIPVHTSPTGLGLGTDIWKTVTETVTSSDGAGISNGWSGGIAGDEPTPMLKWVRQLEWIHDHPTKPRPRHLALNGRRGLDLPDFDNELPGALWGCKCRFEEIWTVQPL